MSNSRSDDELRALLNIGTGREMTAQRKDGSVFPAMLSVGALADSEPPRFVAFVQDLTLRRRLAKRMTPESSMMIIASGAASSALRASSGERVSMGGARGNCSLL